MLEDSYHDVLYRAKYYASAAKVMVERGRVGDARRNASSSLGNYWMLALAAPRCVRGSSSK